MEIQFHLDSAVIQPQSYKALGRTRILLALAIPRAALLIAALALFSSGGIVAVATCQAAVAGAFAAGGMVLAMRLLEIAPRRLWSAAWPSFAAAAGMSTVLLLVVQTIDRPWLALVTGALGGGGAYLALMSLFDNASLRWLFVTAFRGERPASKVDVGAIRAATAATYAP